MEEDNKINLFRFLPDQSLHEVENYMVMNTPEGQSKVYWFRSPEKTDRIVMICGKVSNNQITWFQVSPQ